MMSKFKLLLAAVSVINFTTAHAQTTIQGSPYLDEAFVAGEIHDNARHKVQVRYNLYQDVMEYKQNGVTLALDPSATVKKVQIGTATFVSQKFEFKGKQKYGFYALLDSGKVMLFSKSSVKFMDAKKGGGLDGSDLPARYERTPEKFHYKFGNGELLEVENLKSMIASFPDKQEDLAAYAKKEKISPRKEKTLLQLVRYYNSL